MASMCINLMILSMFHPLLVESRLLTSLGLLSVVLMTCVIMSEEVAGMLVLNGCALLVTKPSVPQFLLDNHKDLHGLEAMKCDAMAQKHAMWANAVKKDPSCKLQSFLIVLPEGMVCTDDLVSMDPSPPKGDKKLKLFLGDLTLLTSVGSKKKRYQAAVLPWLLVSSYSG